MAKKKEEFVKQDEQLQEVNEALTGAGKWIEDNANLISWIVCGIAVVVMGIIAINQYVIKPKALEASNENAKAAAYFQAGDLRRPSTVTTPSVSVLRLSQMSIITSRVSSQRFTQVSAISRKASMKRLLSTSRNSRLMI